MVDGRNAVSGFELGWMLSRLHAMNPYMKRRASLVDYDPYRAGESGMRIRTTDQLKRLLASGRYKHGGNGKVHTRG